MIKGDGNGGFIIQKGAFALIMIILTLISSIGSVVAYSVSIRSDVNYLKSSYDQATEERQEINERLIEQNNVIIINQEKILAMQDDLTEVKSDVKELISR